MLTEVRKHRFAVPRSGKHFTSCDPNPSLLGIVLSTPCVLFLKTLLSNRTQDAI